MIEAMLVLSTAHLTEHTCNMWLHDARVTAFAKGDYGWFVHVAGDEPDNLPADLDACLALGRIGGFAWIMFDRDADIAPGLPVHDW